VSEQRSTLGIYCPGIGNGGPWRYVHSLLAGIDLGEFDVSVFCDIAGTYEPRPEIRVVRLTDGKPVGVLTPAAVRPEIVSNGVHPTGSRPRRIGRLLPGAVRLWAGFGCEARKLARLVREHSVDLFHTQNTGCEESPAAAWLAGVPCVVGTFHVDSTYDLHNVRSGARHRLIEAVSNRCLHTGIAVSNATGLDWIRRTRISPARVTTIYNGIDPEKFRRCQSPSAARAQLGLPNDGRPVIGGVGRLDEAKGFTYLLETAARLRSEYPDLVVAIAGDGPLRGDLEAQAADLGIADAVRFLGFQRDVQVVLDALDVFVLPSLCEALPYAILEAMATELPVVGTAVGGVPEMIVPGETGFVAPARNPDALVDAIRPLLQSADLRQRMGVGGRERVLQHFQERDMVRKTIQLYRDMLACRCAAKSKNGRLESTPT
jgi:glycosyltransferase involved in cell wall biosynthesis